MKETAVHATVSPLSLAKVQFTFINVWRDALLLGTRTHAIPRDAQYVRRNARVLIFQVPSRYFTDWYAKYSRTLCTGQLAPTFVPGNDIAFLLSRRSAFLSGQAGQYANSLSLSPSSTSMVCQSLAVSP